ncbi:MAG TPA: SdrD B-like domain-containing protein, partial [Woeseiaceae bacterium]|nr:SdrD B-like domain-containing protein [Woeseiaceae bacterium]
NLSKTPTKLYPAKTGATSNAPFRLALALTLMDDGYFGTHSNVAADAWYDEYAVNVQKGSANYGAAIPKSNASQVRQNRGWLGNALGPFRRIYDDAAFAASKNLLNNGGFDGGINGWRTANVDLSRETSNAFEGSGALRISPMIKFHDDLGGATAKGPSMSVSGGQTYTVALALRSSAPRDVRVSLGDAAVRVPVGTKWRRYVLTLKPTKSSTSAVQINVGREETIVWADSIYVFKGADPNVFSREFENGMVVANATASSKTISVGSNFRRIKGNQDGTVNNGQNVTSVTLAPYDAVLLVRRESAASGSSTTSTTSGGDATSGSGSVGDLVWQDADGNGVKGASESGWSGVTVRLRECNGPILRSATTDAQGRYLFDTLGAGEYQVEVVLPSGAKHSPNGAGSDGSRDSDINPGTGLSWCTPITSKGENRLSLDAGLVPTSGSGGGSATAGGAALGDYVWHDLNGDGIQNNVEPGIAGVKIKLRDCNGIYHQTTFTDQAGNYSFANLAAGQYLVHFITPAGMQSSPAGIGKEGKDSDADGSGLSHCINLGQNDQRGGIDAGFH